MSYTITAATIQDADELNQLVNSAYRGDSSRIGWTTEADLLDGTRTDAAQIAGLIRAPGTTILKYVADGKIDACVELITEGSKLYLGMLTVRPLLQGRGIGKVLLAAAEAYAAQHSCTAIFMTVITVRKELIDWYIRHGYSDTGQRRPFAFTDPRNGQPRQALEFMVLEKSLHAAH
jgi:ribosomal protein S18 acetylase RimI-like enzyme